MELRCWNELSLVQTVSSTHFPRRLGSPLSLCMPASVCLFRVFLGAHGLKAFEALGKGLLCGTHMEGTCYFLREGWTLELGEQ